MKRTSRNETEAKRRDVLNYDKKPYCGNCGHAPLTWRPDGSAECPECGTVDESFKKGRSHGD